MSEPQHEQYLHIGTVLAERFVEVIHLRHDRNNRDYKEYVGTWVGELVIASKGKLQRDAQSLDCANGDTANNAAYADKD